MTLTCWWHSLAKHGQRRKQAVVAARNISTKLIERIIKFWQIKQENKSRSFFSCTPKRLDDFWRRWFGRANRTDKEVQKTDHSSEPSWLDSIAQCYAIKSPVPKTFQSVVRSMKKPSLLRALGNMKKAVHSRDDYTKRCNWGWWLVCSANTQSSEWQAFAIVNLLKKTCQGGVIGGSDFRDWSGNNSIEAMALICGWTVAKLRGEKTDWRRCGSGTVSLTPITALKTEDSFALPGSIHTIPHWGQHFDRNGSGASKVWLIKYSFHHRPESWFIYRQSVSSYCPWTPLGSANSWVSTAPKTTLRKWMPNRRSNTRAVLCVIPVC